MKALINHFTDNDAYTFSCQYYILQTYPRAEVEYTFFDRNNTIYPKSFDKLLKKQVKAMHSIVISEEEINFMQRRMYYLPQWYFTFLRGYRFNPDEVSISQDEIGHLSIKIKGKWYSTIMWEIPLLSIISELFHEINGDLSSYDSKVEYKRALDKGRQILDAGIVVGDMGTRRRLSFAHHDNVIKALKETISSQTIEQKGRIMGTSNVYLAMKYDLTPIGTMSHQLIEFEENVSGVFECNFNVMRKFSDVYDGDNGTYLYDCFGDKVFFNNLSKRMALMFTGLRVDSGIEEEQVDKIVEKYNSLGINPQTKQVIFSNGLNINRAIEIHSYVAGRVQDSYGIGTFLTCDVLNTKPMNIVIKLTSSRITEKREWHDCIKLSCDEGKEIGNAEKCRYIKSIIK